MKPIKIFIYIVITLIVIILVFSILLSKMNNVVYELSEKDCNKNKGTLVFYECYNGLFNTCSELKTGYWCELSNGTGYKIEINLTGELQ